MNVRFLLIHTIQRQMKVGKQWVKTSTYCNTDDGGQVMGEELRHVQMSRWGKHTTGERSKQQYSVILMVIRQKARHFDTTFHYKNK